MVPRIAYLQGIVPSGSYIIEKVKRAALEIVRSGFHSPKCVIEGSAGVVCEEKRLVYAVLHRLP